MNLEELQGWFTTDRILQIMNMVVMIAVTGLLVYSRVQLIWEKFLKVRAQREEQKAKEETMSTKVQLEESRDLNVQLVNTVVAIGDMLSSVVNVSKMKESDKKNLVELWSDNKKTLEDVFSKEAQRFQTYYNAFVKNSKESIDYIKNMKEDVLSKYLGKDDKHEDNSKESA